MTTQREAHSSASSHPRERLLAEITEELADLKRRGLYREETRIETVDGATVRIGGRTVICWCSNDYLGLSRHSAVTRAAAEAAAEWGVGARASRLLAGTGLWHTRLEAALAAWYRTQAALVFSSGYLANLGALGALCSSEDALFVDRLAHASLIDAARSTRGKLHVFQHNDAAHVAALLAKATSARRRVVITEGVFSMDGDAAPLAALADAAEAHDALLYVDDAHGAFVRGACGRGSCEAEGVAMERVVYMATLGKALGCQGGFIVGPTAFIGLLRNRARTFMYSTGMSVPVAAAALAALRVVDDEPARRQALVQRSAAIARHLDGIGLRVPRQGPSHIVPIVLGETERAVAVARGLWDAGIWAPAIRPPTVPEGTSRLRLSVTAEHTAGQVEEVAEVVKRLVAT